MLSSEPRRRFENRVSLCHWIRGPSLDYVDVVHRTFQEALEVTSTAKARFVHDDADLYERGKRLVTESILAGVTSMRAFVEIDRIVSMHCLNVGLRLKKEFTKECEIQLVGESPPQITITSVAHNGGPQYLLRIRSSTIRARQSQEIIIAFSLRLRPLSASLLSVLRHMLNHL